MANVFKDAAQSFYSGPFYGELARARKGIGFGLIILLTILVSVLMCIGLLMNVQLRDAISRFPAVAATLPQVTLDDLGKLSIDKPVPYRIDISNSPVGNAPSPVWVVIDTNYKLSDSTYQYMHDNHILALLTADKAILAKDQRDEIEIYEFKRGQSFMIGHEQWLKLGDTVARWGLSSLMAIFFISFSIAMFVLNIAATVMTAVVIMALDLVTKTQLEFPAAMRLAAAARIPINLLPVIPVAFGSAWLAGGSGWVLWMLYVVFAVWAVKLHSAHRPG